MKIYIILFGLFFGIIIPQDGHTQHLSKDKQTYIYQSGTDQIIVRKVRSGSSGTAADSVMCVTVNLDIVTDDSITYQVITKNVFGKTDTIRGTVKRVDGWDVYGDEIVEDPTDSKSHFAAWYYVPPKNKKNMPSIYMDYQKQQRIQIVIGNFDYLCYLKKDD